MDTGAVYSDFGHLASLRAEAAANPNAALEDVAQQFESLFLQMMLKSMRQATIKSDLFNSSQLDTYMSMADQQISLSLSENGGIGIARMLVEQMQSKGYVPDEAQSVTGLTEPQVPAAAAGEMSKAFTPGSADSSTQKWEG